MCYACNIVGHRSRGCSQKRTCKICSGRHPTGLHEDNFHLTRKKKLDNDNENKSVTNSATMTTLIEDAIRNETQDEYFAESVPIVPVILRSSDTVVITYAMLDSCSTGTFVLEDLQRELKLDGVDSQVLIKTMNGQQLHNVKVLKGLTVSDLDCNISIVLPKAFTKTEMPATDQDIAAPELARKWPHLTRIADRMHPFIPNTKIGLLIGRNCPKAIEPKDFVTSMNGRPFVTPSRVNRRAYNS